MIQVHLLESTQLLLGSKRNFNIRNKHRTSQSRSTQLLLGSKRNFNSRRLKALIYVVFKVRLRGWVNFSMRSVDCARSKSLKVALDKVRGCFFSFKLANACGDLGSAIFVETSFSTPTPPRMIQSSRR